jgi:hypothetical protein
MALCRSHGIRTLEMPHLFTQWGALATPAIYVEHGGRMHRRFGWDVPATDPSYRALLEQLIPALRAVLDTEWGLGQVIFHISGEPTADMVESYGAARSVVLDLLDGCVVVDALSHFELYEKGLVPIPVVATDAAQPFLDAEVAPLWLYYCVGQHRDVSNRFISLPSSRNRVIGTQLYLAKAAGFLHWGFNFYNSVHSTRPINPFLDTSAGGGFLAGDSFMVYPGPDGVPFPCRRRPRLRAGPTLLTLRSPPACEESLSHRWGSCSLGMVRSRGSDLRRIRDRSRRPSFLAVGMHTRRAPKALRVTSIWSCPDKPCPVGALELIFRWSREQLIVVPQDKGKTKQPRRRCGINAMTSPVRQQNR